MKRLKLSYNEYFGENFKVYTASDFIAVLAQAYTTSQGPSGTVKKQEEQAAVKEEEDNIEAERQDVKGSAKRSAWARLINKVYGINPLICNSSIHYGPGTDR